MNIDQLNQIKQDPIGMAKKSGFNIPDNLANDPQAMVNHLVQTGQITNQKVQWIMNMVQRFAK